MNPCLQSPPPAVVPHAPRFHVRRFRIEPPQEDSAARARLWAVPETLWAGKTVWIIGGGPSLGDMDWTPLSGGGAVTIGCNSAYLLGDWVTMCYWGDESWYKVHRAAWVTPDAARRGVVKETFGGLPQYNGMKATCFPECWMAVDDGVLCLERQQRGFHPTRRARIGWYLSTGASAVAVAARAGAARIVLLGFDMGLGAGGQSNWYNNIITPPQAGAYHKFARGFAWLAADMERCYPRVDVINANEDSALTVFPRVKRAEALNRYA